MQTASAVRWVALLEAVKGLSVLLAGTGLLALLHHDVHALAATLLAHAHLNPASHYPKIFLDAASKLTDTQLWQLAAGAAAYATVRLVEAYGLYRQRTWAELLAAVSGAIYVPFEAHEAYTRRTGLSFGMLVLNLAIVGLMVWALQERRRRTGPR